jgi:hypothetical protein
MNEERTGHLCHRYSIAINQVMVTTVKLSKWWLQLSQEDSVASSLAATNTLSSKFWSEPQALEYRINWEICTPYEGAAGMLLHINGKCESLNNLCCRQVSFIIASSLSRYESIHICVCGIHFFQAQWDTCDKRNYLVKEHHPYSGTWN